MRKVVLLTALASLMVVSLLAVACGGTTEVIKEVEVEKIVEKEVIKEVVKEVPVEKEVIKEVVKEVVVEKETVVEVEGQTVVVLPFQDSFNYLGQKPRKFNEAPMLAARVASGDLPPVEDRLPVASDVLVIPVVENIGEYGGTWRKGFRGPGDGQNMDRVMMDHPLQYDLDGATILPNLIKDWDVSADGLTYTFHLRKGMKWSDGHPFTVDDFIWANANIVRNEKLNPNKEGRLGFSSYGPTLAKVDAATFTASFPEQQNGFLDEMATYRIAGYTLNGRVGAPLFAPAHFLEQFHEDFVSDKAALDKLVKDSGFENWETFFKNKIDVHKTIESPNVGAWIVTQPNTGDVWKFERNPYYYGVDPAGNQLPYVDTIELRLYSDGEVHNLRAIAGEYDFNHRAIDFSKLPVFKQNEEKGNYRMELWPGDATMGISFNYTYGQGDVNMPPDPEIQKWITNKTFKQAMSQALNRPKVNEIVYFGVGNETQPVFPKWHRHYPGEAIEKAYTQFNPSAAAAMLDELGLDKKDGDGNRLRTDGSGKNLALEIAYSSGWTPTLKAAELAKESWDAIGIQINMKGEEGKLHGERRGGNTHELQLDGDVNAREPTSLISGRSAFPAYSNWYASRSGSYTLGAVTAEPPASDKSFWKLVELSDASQTLAYADRTQNYIDTQAITSEELYYVGVIGHTPAANGTIVVKNNFRNVPKRAPNASALQNPGSGRTVQFYFQGGLNDAGY